MASNRKGRSVSTEGLFFYVAIASFAWVFQHSRYAKQAGKKIKQENSIYILKAQSFGHHSICRL